MLTCFGLLKLLEKIHTMSTGNQNHPWSRLKTITTFDDDTPNNPDNALSPVDSTDGQAVVPGLPAIPIDILDILKTKSSTPISLLVQSLVQQLCTMLEPDTNKMKTLYTIICQQLHDMTLIDDTFGMDELEVLRRHYQKALFHLVGQARSATFDSKPPDFTLGMEFCSRYHKEFIQLEYIAGGGFGKVFKAKNRLDGSTYAIKRIIISTSTIASIMEYLHEVKTFASLNHPNVVQYKAAWLEPYIVQPSSKAIAETGAPKNDPPSSDFIVFADSQKSQSSGNSNKLKDSNSYTSDLTLNLDDSLPTESNSSMYPVTGKQIRKLGKVRDDKSPDWAILYIQMQLCQLTLNQWIKRRRNKEIRDKNVNKTERTRVLMDIFRQIVKGLHYIHSKGIIHHDLKPNNVFVNVDGDKLNVQLGDFGLACSLNTNRHQIGCGTELYAAPEQLRGSCNKKNDMYSLGIILYELVASFDTEMERVSQLTNLRNRKMDETIRNEYPQISSIIERLTVKNLKMRPNTEELIACIHSLDKKRVSVMDLERRLSNAEVSLREKDAEIARLKEKLRMAGIND